MPTLADPLSGTANPYNTRLRAGLETLKYQNVEDSRRIADEIRQLIDSRIERLNKLMAVDGLTEDKIRERVLRIWAPLSADGLVEKQIRKKLQGVAKGTYERARDVWLSTLPNPYWWYAAGRILPEAYYRESAPLLEVGEELDPEDIFDELFGDEAEPSETEREFGYDVDLPDNKLWRSLPSDKAKELINRLVFAPPSEEKVTEIIHKPFKGMAWPERVRKLSRFAAPERLAKQFAFSYSQGKTPRQIAKDIGPFVRNYRAGAMRIARTEAGRVAESLTRETYDQCDSLIEGIQVLAVLDDRNYPHHRTRHGQIYWKQEGKGEYHISELPDLPDEPNCRCWTAPVLITDEAVRTEKGNVAIRDAGGTVVDPGRVSDWYDKQTVKLKRAAVGGVKYDTMRKKLGRAPKWEDFIDPATGEHLSLDRLRRETPREHAERVAAVNELTNQIKTKAERHDANLPVEVARQIRTRLKDTGLPGVGKPKRRKTAKVDPASQEKFVKKHKIDNSVKVDPKERIRKAMEENPMDTSEARKQKSLRKRVEEYKVGDAKLDVVRDIDKRLEEENESVREYRKAKDEWTRLGKVKSELREKRSKIIDELTARGRELAQALRDKNNKVRRRLERQIKELRAKSNLIGEEIKDVTQKLLDEHKQIDKHRNGFRLAMSKARKEFFEAIATDDPVELKVDKHASLSDRDIRTIEDAERFYRQVLGKRVPDEEMQVRFFKIDPGDDQRAFHIDGADAHTVARVKKVLGKDTPTAKDNVSVVAVDKASKLSDQIHELGHAIDSRLDVKNLVKQFLDERRGKEKPKPISLDPGAFGVDDDFEKTMGNSARYAGRIYWHGSTEITSMGLEKFFEDPIEFARQDEEYAKLLMGILDGYLR